MDRLADIGFIMVGVLLGNGLASLTRWYFTRPRPYDRRRLNSRFGVFETFDPPWWQAHRWVAWRRERGRVTHGTTDFTSLDGGKLRVRKVRTRAVGPVDY